MALLLISVLSPTGAHAQAAKGRTITGTVLDADAKPVAHATVAVTGGTLTATTGDDGSFSLAGVPAAGVTLDIAAEGYTAKQVPVLNGATAVQLSLVIVKTAAPAPPATRAVGGVVADALHNPIAGATVRVHGTELQAQTDADGSFTLEGVPTTDVALDIEAPNQPPTTATVAANKAAVAVTVGVAPAAPTTRSIKGKVIDPTNKEPIVAAQVQVVGTETVVFTEADGGFVFDGLPLGPVQLEVSAPEHEKRTINVAADQATAEVGLALVQGEQIVIEGRAPIINKVNGNNGASVIKSDDLTRVSAPTLDDAMQGKLAGANLQSNSGAPGGGAQLRLRGISTINGQSSPLYVVDGVIISNVSVASGINAITAAAAGGSTSSQDNPTNRIADLNPNDIENIEVLKGASAAALYGSKAANGVVIITTKRGRNGENHATVTQRFGIAQVSNTLGARHYGSIDEVRGQFCDLTKQSTADCDATPIVQAYIQGGGKTYDHEAEIERTAFMSETLGSVSGGNENGNYFGSVGVNDEPGVVIGTYYRKQNGRIALGYKFGDRVRMGVTANVIHSISDRGLTNNDNKGVSNFVVLSSTPSFVNLKPTNGVYPGNPAIGSLANPLQNVRELTNQEEVMRFITGLNVAVDVVKEKEHSVRLLGNFGADVFNQRNTVVSPSDLTFEPSDGLDGTVIDGNTNNLNFNGGASAVWEYKPDNGAFHNALSLGWTYESVNLNSTYTISQGLTAGQPSTNSGTSITPIQNRLSTKDTGLYLQEEIGLLDDRLSLLGGLLAERSSLNGDTDKYYLYPKFAGSYALVQSGAKEQPAALDMFDSVRFRAAYGEAGNRPNYGYRFTPLVTSSNIDGSPGVVLTGPTGALAGDSSIKPEHQREIELGVDAALKDQRVALELTVYQRSISDLLLQRALAPSTGFTTQYLNGGGLRNRGLEVTLTARPLPDNKLVDWTTRGVLTLNRSTITDLPSDIPPFLVTAAGFGASLGAYRIEPGKSATQIVVSENGNLVVVGNGEPDFRIGWSNVVTAGDFTFSALVDWQHGSDIVNLTRLLYDGSGNSKDQGSPAQVARAALPYVEDASFVKVRELSITYSLPKSLIDQISPIRKLDIGLSGRNLLTFTGYSGLDPEVSNFGTQSIGRNYDVAPYPPSRSYWLSITAGI